MTKTIEEMMRHLADMNNDCLNLFLEIYLKEAIQTCYEFNRLKEKIIRTHEYKQRLLRRLEREG